MDAQVHTGTRREGRRDATEESVTTQNARRGGKSSPKSAPEGAKREIPSPSFGLSEVEKENLDPSDPKALQQEKYVQDGSTNAPPWWLLTMMVTGGNAHSFVP